jgi:hypothetical protein
MAPPAQSPSPVGMVNNPQLLNSARGIVNNYASAHMRQLVRPAAPRKHTRS